MENPMKRAIWTSVTALGLALGGCGDSERVATRPVDRDAAVGGGEATIVETAAFHTDEEPDDGTRKPEEGPKIEEVTLDPDPPVATGPFRVEPVVDNPAPGPLNVTYEWYVNGKEILGIWGDTLPQGKFVRGDVIEVSILARDYNGKVDTFRVRNVQVSNSTPQIISGVGTSSRLDGTVFKAMDPDGDPIRWTLEGGPPGVSLHPTSGRLQIDSSGVYEEGTFEVQVVATDPHGGEGRMGFRIDLSGASTSRTELHEIQDAKVISTRGMSDEELARQTEELLERMNAMSPEELEAYLEKTSVNPSDEAAAVELPVGASPSPY